MSERQTQPTGYTSSLTTREPNTVSKKSPQVRVTQDDDAQPMRVIVVEDKDEPSIGLLAFMIFIGSLLGTVVGLGADFGELVGSFNEFERLLNPPPTLCIVGSGTILGSEGVGEDWATAFEQGRNVQVRVNATGSVGGVNAAADGDCAHILAMSEPMTDEQYTQLIDNGVELDCAAEVGYDIIAFITSINNPLVEGIDGEDRFAAQSRTVQITELRRILTGGITDWSQISNWPQERNTFTHPITIWLRPDSGTTEVVLNRLANFIPSNDVPFPQGARYRFCDSNEDCLNRTLSTPGSIYWVSVAWMRTQPPNYLRVLYLLQGDELAINPLFENVSLSQYPTALVRPLYLYVLDDGNISNEVMTLAEDFLRYARGIDGQVALEARNFYTHFAPPPEVDIDVDFPDPVFNIPEDFDVQRTICRPANSSR